MATPHTLLALVPAVAPLVAVTVLLSRRLARKQRLRRARQHSMAGTTTPDDCLVLICHDINHPLDAPLTLEPTVEQRIQTNPGIVAAWVTQGHGWPLLHTCLMADIADTELHRHLQGIDVITPGAAHTMLTLGRGHLRTQQHSRPSPGRPPNPPRALTR